MRHDFPERECKKSVCEFVQMSSGEEAEADNAPSLQSSGDESMIYLEFSEAVAAVACYKHVNPYTPLSTRLDTIVAGDTFLSTVKRLV